MDIKTIKEIIENDFKSKADVNYFFTAIRSLLEAAKNDDYKIIKFYSDWMLHCKKDNLKEMYKYFEELESLFNAHEVFNRRVINKHIQEITSFLKLREQLKNLLEEIDVEAKFLHEDDKWNNFCKFLRLLILNKPIFLKNLKSNPKYRKIQTFVVSESAPYMIGIENALYWMIFIDTSEFPLSGVIPESIGLY